MEKRIITDQKVAVLGAGSWGTAMADLLARKGASVALWARDPKLAEEFRRTRRNPRYLPFLELPKSVSISSDMDQALADARVVILAVPAQAMREITGRAKLALLPKSVLVSLSKGIEIESGLRMSEVLLEELRHASEGGPGPSKKEVAARVAVLSGPNHAEEVCQSVPSATVVSAFDSDVAQVLQDLFMTSYFRVYTNPDIIGVELGGATKNVIALAAGISDGLGYGDNTKASLMTRGLAEMTRLGQAMGADPLTFAGLAGAGDLIVTCTSRYSRNRWVGERIGKGKTLDEVMKETSMIAEGVKTVLALNKMAAKYGVELPITTKVYEVLYEGKRPAEAVSELMLRGPAEERPWSKGKEQA